MATNMTGNRIGISRACCALLLAGLAGCAGRVAKDAAAELQVSDPHSYARPAEARVGHVSLELLADFTAHTLSGTAKLAIERQVDADSVILDTRDLTIEKVTDVAGNALGFNVGAADPVRGAPLSIALPAAGDTIVITYRTSPSAAAVQWLAPAQTAGGRQPYLFTQGQAILTRTWVPTQDSPGIRQTYAARITVPAGLRAVMSAEMLTPDGEQAGSGVAYRFRMNQPIPPYLFALAIGDLEFRALGPRTGVWSEPAVVERAANEFADLEAMLAAAERLYGPYRWERYDVIVLPPSFPYGGMENPRLTFATPTILAGDRSLVSLVAHELAHSWSGNLVTNATWDDFWLNEGFTTYIERRLMEELRGPEYAAMLRQLGRQDLAATVADLGATSPDTRLHLDLAGRDPDEGTTDIAYEKGAAFLETVEAAVGRERFDAFLRAYFERFAFQPMTTERFLAHLDAELVRGDSALASRIRAQEWAYQPGVPDNVPAVQAAAFTQVESQTAQYVESGSPATLRTQDWTTHEWLHFLRGLPETLSRAQLAQLDRTFAFSRSGNSEILFEWLRIAIRNRYEPAFPALEQFLTSQGRRKFLAPLYTDLAATEWGRPMALRIYARARPGYHAVSTNTIDQILNWREAGAHGGQ
jgi:aminopeptidase N